MFAKFVKKWNSGDLSDKFYNGHYGDAPETASSRTGYKWGFAKGLDADDQRKLDSIRGSVNDGLSTSSQQQQAARLSASSFSTTLLPASALPPPFSAQAGPTRPAGPRQGPAAPDREDLERYKKDWEKKERSSFYKRQKDDLEELVPKETGRDAKIDKRRAMNAARGARDASPDVPHIMGDNFDVHAAVQKKKEAQEHRQSVKRDSARDKLAEHQERERQKLAELLEFARAARTNDSMWKG